MNIFNKLSTSDLRFSTLTGLFAVSSFSLQPTSAFTSCLLVRAMSLVGENSKSVVKDIIT